jgi:hypothetical protein
VTTTTKATFWKSQRDPTQTTIRYGNLDAANEKKIWEPAEQMRGILGDDERHYDGQTPDTTTRAVVRAEEKRNIICDAHNEKLAVCIVARSGKNN